MVVGRVERDPSFERAFSKIRDGASKEKVIKQIMKIINDPEIGKPMMYARKGTREVYVPPFRLSYAYVAEERKAVFLAIYHKDEQ